MSSDLYNLFHSESRTQSRVITSGNFTYRLILKKIDGVLKEKKLKNKILDFGCGVGTVSMYLASKGHKVIGVDVSSTAVRKANESAKQIGLSNIQFIRLREFGKSRGEIDFDLALCLEVLEHVPDDEKVLTELYRRLKKGGKLVLSTPSLNAPLLRLGVLDGFEKRVGHLRRYTAEQLMKLVVKSGFREVDIYKEEGILRNSLYVFRLFGVVIRFLKGPVADLVTLIDNVTLRLFGESDIFVIATK